MRSAIKAMLWDLLLALASGTARGGVALNDPTGERRLEFSDTATGVRFTRRMTVR